MINSKGFLIISIGVLSGFTIWGLLMLLPLWFFMAILIGLGIMLLAYKIEHIERANKELRELEVKNRKDPELRSPPFINE